MDNEDSISIDALLPVPVPAPETVLPVRRADTGFGRPDDGWWAGREAARTPIRFRERVIALFRHPNNLEYLHKLFGARMMRDPSRQFVLDALTDMVYSFVEGEGRGLDVLQSDPSARRGGARTALDQWAELRRLNRAFFEDRMAMVREQAALITGSPAPRDGVDDDNEQYHMRMFIADSLRPPGLEHLNAPGPLYALREDQSTWRVPRPRGGPSRERMAVGGRPVVAASTTFGTAGIDNGEDSFNGGGQLSIGEDTPWRAGDPNRTAEEAIAEYYGDDKAASDTALGGVEPVGQIYGQRNAWGDEWLQNGGTRFMRREQMPFWQKGGRTGYERNIEETLGTAGRELDAPVRRWDMSRVRDPRGRDTRRYGVRSGHVI